MNFFPKEKEIVTSSRGFSLVEILIALTLLALAGTFVAGKFFDQLYEGQKKATVSQMKQYEQRLKEYRRKCGAYPTTDQGLEALIEKPSSGRECKNYPPNGFIDGGELINDPWDNDYAYESDGKKYNIWSLGQDGEEGGEDTDADIYLREKKD